MISSQDDQTDNLIHQEGRFYILKDSWYFSVLVYTKTNAMFFSSKSHSSLDLMFPKNRNETFFRCDVYLESKKKDINK